MSTVILERQRSAAWLRLNRPEELNAINGEMAADLAAALRAAADDDSVRSLVITGVGRAFCAGADLRYVKSVSANGIASGLGNFLHQIANVFSHLERIAKPTIAAVNGVAVAGGLELILCCDIVIAAESAKMGDGHANFGMVPGGGGSVRLPRRIGAARAKELLFTGKLMPARDLEAWGLVNRTVPAGDLSHVTAEFAHMIESKSPLGLATMKQLVGLADDRPLDNALAAELSAFASYASSTDMQEGLAAFDEHRTPRFLGR
jgi:enoyl-CoA hydratase